MKDHQNHFPVQAMAEVLQVSASGFYAWRTRPPCDRSVRDRQLVPAVRAIHAELRCHLREPAHGR